MHLAVAAPRRVRTLVLLDPAIGLDPVDVLQKAEDSAAPPSFASPSDARAAMAAEWLDTPSCALDAEIVHHLERCDDGRYRWRYCASAVVSAWSEMARVHEVPPRGLPTLLVPALRADYVTAAFVQDCSTVLEECLTVREVDCGHRVYFDAAEEVGALVVGFLRR